MPLEGQQLTAEPPDEGRGLARSGVIFAIATGVSRVIGLVREIAQAAIFGISGPVNAFEIAFLIPNTVRSLVADSALSAAFVPVFSDLLVKGERQRAWRVASSIFWLMLLGLGGLTAFFIVIAPWVMELFGYGPEQLYGDARHRPRTHPLPARARPRADRDRGRDPQQLRPLHRARTEPGAVEPDHPPRTRARRAAHELATRTRLYIYAVAILVATIAQFLLPSAVAARARRPAAHGDRHPRPGREADVRADGAGHDRARPDQHQRADRPAVRDALTSNTEHRAGRDRAGVPALHAAAGRVLGRGGDGALPAAVAPRVAAGLERHSSRHREHGAPADLRSCSCRRAWRRRSSRRRSCGSSTSTGTSAPTDTPIVAACLAAFALGLTFNGTMLMLNRGFFSLQSPWIPSWVAFGNLGLNAVLDAVFYRFGIWGIPLSTSLVNIAGTAALLVLFRRRMGGFELRETARSFVLVCRRVGGARRGGMGRLAPARLGARPVAAGADRLRSAPASCSATRPSSACAGCWACASWTRCCGCDAVALDLAGSLSESSDESRHPGGTERPA